MLLFVILWYCNPYALTCDPPARSPCFVLQFYSIDKLYGHIDTLESSIGRLQEKQIISANFGKHFPNSKLQFNTGSNAHCASAAELFQVPFCTPSRSCRLEVRYTCNNQYLNWREDEGVYIWLTLIYYNNI